MMVQARSASPDTIPVSTFGGTARLPAEFAAARGIRVGQAVDEAVVAEVERVRRCAVPGAEARNWGLISVYLVGTATVVGIGATAAGATLFWRWVLG